MSGSMLGLGLSFIYMAAMIWVGVICSRWIRSGDDFLLSGRELGWFVLAGGTAAMQMAGTTVAGYPGTAYFNGWGNLWGAWGWVLSATVFLLLFSRFSRRTGAFTTVEWFEAKYGTTNRIILACGTCIALLFGGMGQFVGCANIIVGWTGIDYITAVVVIGVATIVYMFVGGFWATMITDTIQFLIGGVVIYIGLPLFLFTKFGGFSYLTTGANALPAGMLDFPFGTATVFNWKLGSVIGLIAMNFSFMLANSYYWNKSVAARSDRESFKGWLIAAIFIIPFGIVTTLVGLYARATFPGIKIGDQVFGLMLGQMNPFLAALMMVGVLAATQSTADAIMLGCSTILTKDIVARIWPKANLLRVGQWLTALIGVLVFALAIGWKQGALYGLATMGTFVVPALPPLVASVLAPKWVTKEGSALGMATAIIVGIYWQFISTPPLWQTVHTMYVTFGLSLSIMIVVSFIVKMTGPWWTEKQDIKRLEFLANFGGKSAGGQSVSFAALFCELAKPIIKIPFFIRFVETVARKKDPSYVSILADKN